LSPIAIPDHPGVAFRNQRLAFAFARPRQDGVDRRARNIQPAPDFLGRRFQQSRSRERSIQFNSKPGPVVTHLGKLVLEFRAKSVPVAATPGRGVQLVKRGGEPGQRCINRFKGLHLGFSVPAANFYPAADEFVNAAAPEIIQPVPAARNQVVPRRIKTIDEFLKARDERRGASPAIILLYHSLC
jgi:hypothetical protein